MLDNLNAQMKLFATGAQTTLGWIAVVMLITFAVGILYYLFARAVQGPFPALYQPVSGDWVKITAITWFIGMAAFGGLYALITTSIGAGGFTGQGG